ncbi:hypothetical protein AT251_24195 [Enterovibrio nigricans]|nr:hypothetical protein [Enterovibrio nigricans]PKF48702.1 hypothetical protein AT251_24195 [Enterovibrio nigricans]
MENEADITPKTSVGNSKDTVTDTVKSTASENSEASKSAVSNCNNSNENTPDTSGNSKDTVTDTVKSTASENSEASKTAVSNAYNANPEDDDETDDGWSRVLPWVVALIALAGAGWLAWKWIAKASQQEGSKEVTYVWQ